MQTLELKLSKENRIHFAEGFIQVPVAGSKELYGIKFENVVQGEEFYSRMIHALGKLVCMSADHCFIHLMETPFSFTLSLLLPPPPTHHHKRCCAFISQNNYWIQWNSRPCWN